jgi:hypothetical protein
MKNPGYWIECMPLSSRANENRAPELYTATIDGFPELNEQAPSPDQAIDRLRQKLMAIKADYAANGRLLPTPHSPVQPPSRNRSVQGWLSVYIEVQGNNT